MSERRPARQEMIHDLNSETTTNAGTLRQLRPERVEARAAYAAADHCSIRSRAGGDSVAVTPKRDILLKRPSAKGRDSLRVTALLLCSV
jgi:hypothetical protein